MKERVSLLLFELPVAVTLITLFFSGGYLAKSSLLAKSRAKQAATQARVIHGWLMTYAGEHGGKFPTGDSANAAYRELFKISVGADEKQFAIPGDAWHEAAPGHAPDGDTGKAPDFRYTLEAGENAFAYVSGLTSKSSPRLPLIANAFTSQPGVWTNNKNAKGGVFGGKFAVICRVSGSSSAYDLKEGDWTVKEKTNGPGPPVNIFTPGFEDTNFCVLNPL